MIAASSSAGGSVFRGAGPVGPERDCELLGLVVVAPGESIDRAPLGARRPGRRCGRPRRSRRIPSDLPSPAITSDRQPIRPAQSKGASGDIISVFAKRETISGVGDQMAGKAAIPRIAGKLRAVAEVLLVGTAVKALAAGEAEPWHADTHGQRQAGNTGAQRFNPADDFMPGNDRVGDIRQFAVHDMQIGPADAARAYLDADLARPRNRIWPLQWRQSRAARGENHRMHVIQILS